MKQISNKTHACPVTLDGTPVKEDNTSDNGDQRKTDDNGESKVNHYMINPKTKEYIYVDDLKPEDISFWENFGHFKEPL